MALSCDPNDLAAAARCFKCLPGATLQEVQAFLLCQIAQGAPFVSSNNFKVTTGNAQNTISNSAAETRLMPVANLVGDSIIIQPSEWVAGLTVETRITGSSNMAGGGNMEARMRLGGLGGTVVFDTGAQVVRAGGGILWYYYCTFTFLGGSANNITASGDFLFPNVADYNDTVTANLFTIDPTQALEITPTFLFTIGAPANSITTNTFRVLRFN